MLPLTTSKGINQIGQKNNEQTDKIVLDTGGNIKEYVIYYTNADNTYFAYRGKRYYLEEFYFK